MIQSLNSVNTTANCCGTKRKQSFGESSPVQHNRPSKAKRVASYTAMQFGAGAIVSAVFDGMTNLWRTAFKNKELMSLKEMGGKAAFTGTAFAVIGLVFTAISAAMARKDK